jgi:cell division protein FtsI (penicillin-binding protein 3)
MARKRQKREEIRKLWDENPAEIPLKNSKKRALVLFTVIFFSFAVILFRLIDLMVLDHEKLSKRAARQHMREKTLKPQRGVMWDRRMREMAANVEVKSLYAVPSQISDTRRLSRKLAPLIKASSKKINTKLLRKKDKDFVWLARKVDVKGALKINTLREKMGYTGLGFVEESKRYYPKGYTGSHIIGFTDVDNKGIAGLELLYDTYLKGEVSRVSIGRDARGNRLSTDMREGIAGNNLVLTIDEGIQYIVERELSKAMSEWKAKAAVAVLMDPMTGQILAMANRPAFNPNSAGRSKTSDRRNRAITDMFEPGSTLKSILAAAALEEGVADLDEIFDVSQGYIVVGGKRVRDTHKLDSITFQEIIQRSSNVGAVQVGLRLGKEKYYEYIKRFGFGEKSGIDFPGEVKGILRDPENWSGTSLAALSIGQEIGVTPLQILRAYAAIANGGLLMKPYIVSDIISPDGKVIKRVSPEVEKRSVSRATAETVTEILKMVVEEGGTAQKADMRGNLVAGKTGTAQIFDLEAGRYSRDKFVSSFVGFVPADNPVIALIVVVYEPEGDTYGGTVAAPVFKSIIENTFAYMSVPMESHENQIVLVSKTR